MTQQPHEPGAVDEEPIEEFLERLVNGEPISRRTVLQRFAAAGLTVGAASALPRRLRRGGGDEEVRHDRRRRERQPPEGRRSARSSSRTGRSTSTRRSSRGWEKEHGAKLQLHRGLQRQRGVLRQGPPGARGGPAASAATSSRRPTGWPARWIDLGYATPIDKKNVPNAKNLQDSLAAPAVRQEPRLHAAVAVRHHGHRLQPEEDRAQAHERQRPLRPGVQGPRLDVQRVARLGRPRAAGHGQGPDDGDQGRLHRGDRQDRRGEQEGPDPQFTGNDYTKDLAAGNLWACVAWSGDLVQLQGRQPGPRVPRARGGRR